MTYKNVAWESEAKHIMSAFEIKTECRFIANGFGAHHLKSENGNLANLIHKESKLYCTVSYSEIERYFVVSEDYEQSEDIWSGIAIDWSGNVLCPPQDFRLNLVLTKGLFHLHLLTEEIERALKVSISAHQKIEWLLEYNQANGVHAI